MEHVLGFGSADRLVHRAQPAAENDDRGVLVAEQNVDRADAVGEHGDVGGIQVPRDELGGGAGVQDHDRAVCDQFGRVTADGVLLCGELQVALVDRQLGRAGQGDAAVGAGDVPVLVQSAQVASHRGERDAESFGDLLHAQGA